MKAKKWMLSKNRISRERANIDFFSTAFILKVNNKERKIINYRKYKKKLNRVFSQNNH
jgi:hypothetical protein